MRYTQEQVDQLVAEAREDVLSVVTTEWGVHWEGMGGVNNTPQPDRETAETIVRNVKNAKGQIDAEVVWRGVTPWLKAEEAD